MRYTAQDPQRSIKMFYDHLPQLSQQKMEKDRMTENYEEQPRIARDINLQIRLNEFENNMINDLAEAYGLKRTDVIRRLIRDEWMSLTRD